MSKKTETIEIRVSPELKSELSALSAAHERSMSEVVRGLIQSHVASGGQSQPDGDTLMFRNAMNRAAKAALISLPLLALVMLYSFSASPPVAASSEFRLFFAELDVNADNRVTAEEYTRFLIEEEAFEPEADCAAEGEPCSAAELAAADIARIDSDADNSIAYVELEAFLLAERAAEFLEVDLNGNGFVTADEYTLVEAFHRQEEGEVIPATCVALVENETPKGAVEACGADEDLRFHLAEIDADFDGRVSLLEYLQH